ncbi:MAG: hypothetical protein ABIK37_02945 [candidate division WOR-3 bacterium]
MNQPLHQIRLGRDFLAALARIRAAEENPLLGLPTDSAETLVRRLILPLLENSGLPRLAILHYSWFLRELARLWRSHPGPDLAFHLELAVRKWTSYGLEPNTLQLLVCQLLNRLESLPRPGD